VKARRSALALAAFMAVAGVAHFVVPPSYERIVPRLLGDPAFWVRWSGVAELACAGLLVDRRTRRIGGMATVAVLVAVFPANVQMALDGRVHPVVAWGRLPLQVPLILWAWRVAGGFGASPPAARPVE
jgi:uncharacterized membrane protein